MIKLNKESIQQLMLLHAEKLILGVCLALTAVVVWMSMGTKSNLDQTPDKLLAAAKQAEETINANGDDAWEKLAPFRMGNDMVKEQIVNSPNVDPSRYNLANFIGSPAAALASRRDPVIYAPEQLVATRMVTALMMEVDRSSAIDRFAPAPVKVDESEDSQSAGGGFDGFGDLGSYNNEDDGEGSDTRGSDSRGGIALTPPPELDHNGQQFRVNDATRGAVRPTAFGFSPERIKSGVFDVVCVTAVVDYKKQLEEFKQTFAESVAYFPERDRPVYQFLQVQRRVVGDKEDQWTDISELVSYSYPSRFPKSMHKMPLKLFSSAPEVAAAENWDPMITKEIPAFSSQEYTEFCLHPALEKKREFAKRQGPKIRKTMMSQDVEGGAEAGNDIFDFDPEEDEDSGFGSLGSGAGESEDPNFRRRGSVFLDYEEAIFDRKATPQYKLVRFFDLRPPRNKSCEYRVRVWVGDPNHEDPQNGFVQNRGNIIQENGQRGAPGGGFGGDDFGGGLGAGGSGGFAGGGIGGGRSDSGAGNGSGTKDGEEEEEEPDYVYRRIIKGMLRPEVRKRLSVATTDEEVLKAPTDQFYVSEYVGDEKDEPTKIMLPESKRKFAYIQYLRYARPSVWSDPVKVEVDRVSSRVVAGVATKGKTVSISNGQESVNFDTEESSIEVAVTSLDAAIGAEVPSRRQVFVGETLNFDSTAYVLHPVNQRWVIAENPRVSSDSPSKYIIPFRTGQTVVDAIAGETLDLPGSRKKAYNTATEVLVMDALGNMKVANEFEQETEFRNLTAMPDESRLIGRRKKPKQKSEDEDDFDDFDF